MKIWLLLSLILVISCKESKPHDYDKRHALVVDINSEDNLLTYSYSKDNDYAIKIEDLKTNKVIFSTKIKEDCFTESKTYHGKLYFPDSDNIFTCIDYKSNKVIWELPTNGRIREFQFVKDNLIIASIDLNGLVAINSNTGKVVYELMLHSNKDCLVDNAPRPISFDKNYFYVTDFNCHSISAYEISSGKNIWARKEDSFMISNLAISGGYIFMGSDNMESNENDKKNEIILLEAKTGKLLFKQSSSFNIFMDPVVYQNKVYYQTDNSLLKEFDTEKKTIKTTFDFNKTDHIGCNQIYQIDHFIYIQDCNYNVNKIDLKTNKRQIVGKGEKGLLGVYRINNTVKFVY